MKRTGHIFSLILIIFFFISCSSSKEARSYSKTLNGNWQLQTISTEGIMGKVKMTLFNEADFNCFIGSSWNFNNYNDLGSYTINSSADCSVDKRNIRWTIYEAPGEPKLFQFKRLTDKLKEVDDGAGFRFSIIQLDNSIMKLKSTMIFEGKSVSLVYNFVRN